MRPKADMASALFRLFYLRTSACVTGDNNVLSRPSASGLMVTQARAI